MFRHAENGECRAVFSDGSGEMPLDEPSSQGSVAHLSKIHGTKAGLPICITCFFWGSGHGSDAKTIDNNLATEALGENEAEDAATKSTARRGVSASHRRESP